MKKNMMKDSSKSKVKMSKKASLGPAMSAGPVPGMKCGGMAKGYAKGGKIDGCAKKGHTKGKMI